MKKILSILLLLMLMFGTVISSPSLASTMQADSSVTAQEFADGVGNMIRADGEDLLDLKSKSQIDPESDIYSDFSCLRLIVKSKGKIDTLGALEVVEGYDGLWVLRFSTARETAEAYDYYSTRSGIEFVEADREIEALDLTPTPAPPRKGIEKKYLSWGPEHIGIDKLNEEILESDTSPEISTVAVIDTGVDTTHPFLAGRVSQTKINTSSSGTRNSSEDDCGHGTQVAGVIADSTLDCVNIRAYKVLNNYGKGTLISLAAGINCAIRDEVDIINISVGFDESSDVLEAAIKKAEQNDIIVIGAAGNDASNTPIYPASYDSVLKITAVNESNVIANFSNYGDDVDFAAPGVQIYTTTLGGEYITVKGTSFAAPFAAAIFATVKSAIPNASPEEIKDIIKENAIKFGDVSAAEKYGNGVIYSPSSKNLYFSDDKTSAPYFSHEVGIYEEEIDLEILCDTPNSVIYYTTDKTMPSKSNKNAIIYDGKPIRVTHSISIMAVAYCDNYYRSAVGIFNAVIAKNASESLFTIDENGIILSYNSSSSNAPESYLFCMTVPDYINGTKVTGIGDNVFYGSNIDIIVLPDSVKSIGNNAFEGCRGLKTIFASGLTEIGDRAFYDCILLKTIFFGDLSSIGSYAFFNVCSKSYELYGSSYSLSLKNVTSIPEGAFMCSAISNLNLGSVSTIGKNAFSECTALVSVNADRIITLPDGAFKGCSSLTDAKILGLTFLPRGVFSTCENLIKVCAPDATFINSNAFENCVSLSDVELDAARTIYSNAFSGCTSLITLDLPSMVSFEDILYLKKDSSVYLPPNLMTLIAPKFEKTYPDMFRSSPNISRIYFNSVKEIANYTFRGCYNIYILNIESVASLSALSLFGCSAEYVDARSLVETAMFPNNSGIMLSSNFVESTGTAENLTLYGTSGTFVERYAKHKGYQFVPIPFIVSNTPEYITENSERVQISVVGFDLEYQWYWNTVESSDGGTPIAGATEPNYIFTQADTAPYYYCVITQHDGEIIRTIVTDIISKDTVPADYSDYNSAVAKAAAIDRTIYSDLTGLDRALAVDVSGRYSCEQAIVDVQTNAILEALSSLKLKVATEVMLYSSDTDLKLFDSVKIISVINPVDALYEKVEWVSDNPNVVLVSKTGYARCIGDGGATIRAIVTNADGTTIEGRISLYCELTVIEKIFGAIFKYIFIIAAKTNPLNIIY